MQAASPDDPTEVALFELVSYEPQHVAELRSQFALPTPVVSFTLAMLELKGLPGRRDAVYGPAQWAEYRGD